MLPSSSVAAGKELKTGQPLPNFHRVYMPEGPSLAAFYIKEASAAV